MLLSVVSAEQEYNPTLQGNAGQMPLSMTLPVKSLVVYLSVVQFLPYGRIADFLLEVCNLSISEGSMVNWINEAKTKAKPAIDKIRSSLCSQKL